MTFRQFAFNNVYRNARAYVAYFLSSSFAVMTFFTYLIFIFHPDIVNREMGAMTKAGMMVASYITFIFSFLFVLYSIGSFLKVRMKEFGILTILGAAGRQLNHLIFLENMIIGMTAVAAGIVGGLVFSKLFLMLGSKALEMKELPMYFPIKAIGITFFSFIALFLVISLMTTVMVRQHKALEMLQSASKPKKEPKASIWLSLLSISAFTGAFYLLRQGIDADEVKLLVIMLLDMIGTYFFFTQFSVLAVRLVKKNRSFVWRGLNLLWVSELAYKIRDNARMFFMITIVTAITCTAAGVVLAINKQTEYVYKEDPFAFSYFPLTGATSKNEMNRIDQELKQSGIRYEKVGFRQIRVGIKGIDHYFILMQHSDYERLTKLLSLPHVSLQKGEALLIHSKLAEDKFSGLTELTLNKPQGITFKKKKEFTKTLFSSHVVVVSDTDFKQIMQQFPPAHTEENFGYLVPEWSNHTVPAMDSQEVRLGMQLDKSNKDRLRNGEADGIIVSRASNYMNMKQVTNIMVFVGLFITVIFSVFTASFLYFRLFNDLQQDQRYYHSLSKMGLSEKEMKKTATIQIALLFYIPLVFSVLQTLVGLSSLKSIFYFTSSMMMVSLIAVGVFIILQTIYFLVVRSRFLAQLKRVMV
ncbi:MAG: ABC transporter permease [Thermoactinomyces sp.]